MLVAALRSEASPRSGTKVRLARKGSSLACGCNVTCCVRESAYSGVDTPTAFEENSTVAVPPLLCHHEQHTTTCGANGSAPLPSVWCKLCMRSVDHPWPCPPPTGTAAALRRCTPAPPQQHLLSHSLSLSQTLQVIHCMRHGITEMNEYLSLHRYDAEDFKDPLMWVNGLGSGAGLWAWFWTYLVVGRIQIGGDGYGGSRAPVRVTPAGHGRSVLHRTRRLKGCMHSCAGSSRSPNPCQGRVRIPPCGPAGWGAP